MTFRYEHRKIKEGYTHIIGCDEVGRGSLAGPVIAASVILDLGFKISDLKDIKDSKLLSPQKREALSEIIKQHALWSVGVVSQKVIDRINIHNATLLAMRRAVERLLNNNHPASRQARDTPPLKGGDEEKKSSPYQGGVPRAQARGEVVILIDGRFTIPGLDVPQEPIIDGDNKVLSIAAASIIAKVYRDGLMRDLHQDYPVYNLIQHKGYGTLYHRKMILQHGLSPLHRLSFCGHLCR